MASSSPDEVHVLLVDDDRVTRTVVAGLLRKCRYQVTSVSSGREALAMLASGTEFNLLLTDVMMPDVDGPALLHRVREDPDLHEMPVVMMSSNEHAEVVLNCLRLGAEDYLLKPVTKKAVKHMWAHVWRRKQSNQMVPRFENGAEVLDDDEFDHRMARGSLASAGEHGVVTVPDPDEFSSDGEHSDGDDLSDEDNQTHQREFVAGATLARDAGRSAVPMTHANANAHPGAPMEKVREGFAEGFCGAGGAGSGRGAHSRATLGIARQTAPGVDDAMETNDALTIDAAAAPLGRVEAAFLSDPLLTLDPADTTKMRRLQSMPPIEGLALGKRTIRDWLDSLHAKGIAPDRDDALHVLTGCAGLLASAHVGGTLLRAMRPSQLTVSPQGDIGLAPPRPMTPPRRERDAVDGRPAGRGARHTDGRVTAPPADSQDRDESSDEDDAMADDQTTRVDAAASSSFFASAAASVVPTADSNGLKQSKHERNSNSNSNEQLYVSPEEKAGSSVPGAPAECFALGVLMVELCWPEIATGARGDVGALLAATLRPDGAGAAALALDPEESVIAKQLLQPVPGNRPSAAQTRALLVSVAEGKIRRADTDTSGWRTQRERGMASEKRRAELVALAGFLRANREARAREAQAHRVRSALLAHALRQLGGLGVDDHHSAGHGVTGGVAQRNETRSRKDRLASGGSFEHAARGSRRGVSFDLSRANRGTHTPGGFTPGDAPPGEKPSKRRRAPGGAPAGTLEQALEKLSNGSETDVNANAPRSQSSAPSSADDGSPKAVSRPPSRQGSFNENAVEGLERTVSASADARRPSLDRVKSLQTAPSLDRVKALQASEAPSRNMGLVAARSFSAGDLTLLDAGDAAAAAAAGGHRGAHELDAAAFEALEENFFQSCARAVAPVARAYAHATRTDAFVSVALGNSKEVSQAPGSVVDPNAAQLSVSARRGAAEQAANAAGSALSDAFTFFGHELAQSVRKTQMRVIADVSHGDVHSFGEMICSVGWDRDGEYVATAGISKRLRIFETKALVSLSAAVQCPVAETRVASKLSSLAWNPYARQVISFADYDGAISLFDANAGSVSCELKEHEKRVWSLDFSTLDPTLLCSGSDDGLVKVWSTSQRQSAATIKCRANVCSVQFSPVNANVVAFSSAAHQTHVYDLRRTQRPLVVLAGHKRAVSYVKWLGAHQLITASTDNTLKLWDVTRGFDGVNGAACDPCVRTFGGHQNKRNFVGMDVSKDGRIVCGSEDNTVCLFSKSVPTPVAMTSLSLTAAWGHQTKSQQQTPAEKPGLFVSAVAWSPCGERVLAANSCGAVKVLELTHDESS